VIVALLERSELRRDLMRVTSRKNGVASTKTDSPSSAAASNPRERIAEGLLNRLSLLEVIRDCSYRSFRRRAEFAGHRVRNVRPSSCRAAAIEANVIGPHAIGKRLVIKEWRIPFVDLQPEFSLVRVPEVCEKPGNFCMPVVLWSIVGGVLCCVSDVNSGPMRPPRTSRMPETRSRRGFHLCFLLEQSGRQLSVNLNGIR